MSEMSTYGNPRFPVGARARIASTETLKEFAANWKYHHQLRSEQLAYADRVATVKEVGWYHGGDAVYTLEGVPGNWLDPCLLNE